jgi:integrase
MRLGCGRLEVPPAYEPYTRPSRRCAVLEERRRALEAQHHPGLAEDWVFATSEGTLLITSTLRKPFRRALAACGITRRQTIHGLRRTFNNLVRQVASGEVVRSMTGPQRKTPSVEGVSSIGTPGIEPGTPTVSR